MICYPIGTYSKWPNDSMYGRGISYTKQDGREESAKIDSRIAVAVDWEQLAIECLTAIAGTGLLLGLARRLDSTGGSPQVAELQQRIESLEAARKERDGPTPLERFLAESGAVTSANGQ